MLAIAPTVAGEEKPPPESGTPAPADVAGTWVSDVRQTAGGPMTFTFTLGADGRLDVLGTPAAGSDAEEFRRSGTYRLDDGRLVSPVINEGRPARLALQDGRLSLTIDETLAFRLWRR